MGQMLTIVDLIECFCEDTAWPLLFFVQTSMKQQLR